jgi:hypothetical protein
MPTRYYVTDYPNWTRLIVAQGDLFDVFDDRTTDMPANEVVGARAAVRWVNTTIMPNGKAPQGVAGSDGLVSPRPGIVNKPFFSIQPFYWQRYLAGYNAGNPQAPAIKQLEWNNRYPAENDQIGRLDVALLRCADWEGTDEVTALIRYNRLSFDYTAVPNPLSAANNVARMTWVKNVIDHSLARWNGHDAHNDARAWVMPRPASPPQTAFNIRCHVVTILQFLKGEWSHFLIKVIGTGGTSSMGEVRGTGNLRVNCDFHDDGSPGNDIWGVARSARGLAAAHELGHCGSLPDEYGNASAYSVTATSYGESPRYTDKCLLGCPYIYERAPIRGLMNYNWYIRARYFWHVAEWLRLIPAFAATDFKIEHYNRLSPGANPESDFFLPHYPHNDPVYRARNFVCWPVSFNLRSRTGGVGGNSYFDSVLYMLGADRYSTVVLPQQMIPIGGARIDGILLIQFRIYFNLTNIPGGAAFTTRVRNFLYQRFTESMETQVNFRRTANFRLTAAAGSPLFSRCLIHFVPCLTTDAGLTAASPQHLTVRFQQFAPAVGSPPGSPPFASPPDMNAWTNNAPAGASNLLLNIQNNLQTLGDAAINARLQAFATEIWQKSCLTMNLDFNNLANLPSYDPIVRTVIDAGAPNPTIS